MRPWNLGLMFALFADCGDSASSDNTTGRDTGEPMSAADTASTADSGFTGDTGSAHELLAVSHEVNAITIYQYVPFMDCHGDYCVDSWVANEWALSRYHNDAPDGCPECDVTTTMQVWRKWFSCGLLSTCGRVDDILAVGLSTTTGSAHVYAAGEWMPLDEFTGSTFSEHPHGLIEWTDHTTGDPRYSYEYYGSSPCADSGEVPGYFQYIINWY